MGVAVKAGLGLGWISPQAIVKTSMGSITKAPLKSFMLSFPFL
jgi:hypothetical protein